MKARRTLANTPVAGQYASAGATRTPLDWARDTGHLAGLMEAIELRKRRRKRRRAQAALGCVVALVVAGLGWIATGERPRPGEGYAAAGRTIVSSPERRTLPDGSIVELRSGSDIAVEFSGALRRVVLRRGEALFQAAPDPERPFVVAAGGMEFRALGTVFAIQLHSARVAMLVTEGRVAVVSAEDGEKSSGPGGTSQPPPAPLAIVRAGHQVALDLPMAGGVNPPEVIPISSTESAQRLAWRVPRLELTDTPLAEVLAGINRHSAVQLELGHPDLAKVEISGILQADNVEPLVRMLEDSYGIRAERQQPGKITLHKAQ